MVMHVFLSPQYLRIIPKVEIQVSFRLLAKQVSNFRAIQNTWAAFPREVCRGFEIRIRVPDQRISICIVHVRQKHCVCFCVA